ITPADSIFKTVEFELQVSDNREVKIKNKDFELDVPVGELFAIPDLGYVRLQRNEEELLPENGSFTQKILVRPPSSVTADYRSRLTVGVTNKQTSTIDLSFDYPVPRKGERILQTLIDRYVERTLEDKNTVADSTLAFINDRLLFVGNELGMAEQRIQDFKQESQLADISAQSQILIQDASAYAKDLAAVESQLMMIDEADRYLADVNNLRVVPTTVGESNPTFNALVQNYNQLLMERERLRSEERRVGKEGRD